MALKRQVGELLYADLVSTVAVEKKGLVLKRSATDPTKLEIATALSKPFGVAYKTTEDPLKEGSYLKGVKIAVIRWGVAEVWLKAGEKVSAGDILVTAADGEVKKLALLTTPTDEDSWNKHAAVVGEALESLDLSTATEPKLIKCLLMIAPVDPWK